MDFIFGIIVFVVLAINVISYMTGGSGGCLKG